MPLGFIGNVFGSAISAAASAANTKQINETNLKIAEMTNKANRELVDAQNKAAKEESELAYQRSKPTTQVGNMVAAGMSRAGAINALNGGGSYTPAPVNTSQDSAPQMQTTDLTALANIGQGLENISQRKHEEKMQAKQLAAQKEEAQKQRDHEYLLEQMRETTQTHHDYLDYEKHKERLGFDYANARQNWRKIEREILKIERETKHIDVQIKGTELDNVRKKFENENYPTLAKLCNEKTQADINRLILEYNQAVENHTLDTEAKRLLNEFNKVTHNARVSAENMRNELSAYMDYAHLKNNTMLFGLLAAWEIFANDYMPKLARFK